MNGFDPHELISAYIDGKLTAAESEVAERLLASSPEHQNLYQSFQRNRRDLNSLPKLEAPTELYDRVMQQICLHQPTAEVKTASSRTGEVRTAVDEVRIPSKSQRRRPPRWLVPLLGLASAAVIIGTLLSIPWSNNALVDKNQGSNVNPLVTKGPLSIPDGRVDETITAVKRGPKWSIIFDVTITAKGQKNRVFETLLGKYRIRVDNVMKVEPKLEERILASHFLENAKVGTHVAPKVGDDALDVVHLVYVVATSIQVDALVFDCQERVSTGEIAKLPWYHLVFEMDKQDMLQQLNREASLFAQQQGKEVENTGFRLEFRSALRSLPGAVAAISSPVIPNLVPNATTGAARRENEQLPGKNSIEQMRSPNVSPVLPALPSNDRPQVADHQQAPVPGQLLFIVRNLKEQQ